MLVSESEVLDLDQTGVTLGYSLNLSEPHLFIHKTELEVLLS